MKDWLIDTVLRAVKTAAQTAVALLGTNTAGLTDVGWVYVLDVAALAAVVSVLHNLAGLKVPTHVPVQPEPAGDVAQGQVELAPPPGTGFRSDLA